MHDLHAFFEPLKNLRLTPQERARVRLQLLKTQQVFPHEEAGKILTSDERGDTLRELCSFMGEFPNRDRMEHITVSFAVWQGGNLFRHVQPFTLRSPDSPPVRKK